MAAKLLHSLTDDNPDLQKQIGCMTGIFQLFDRQLAVAGGRRVGGQNPKRLLPPGRESHDVQHMRPPTMSQGKNHYGENIQEKQRPTAESSRASLSSSRSSSFSSLDGSRCAPLEPAPFDRITFPEATLGSSPRFGRQSLDLRDFVKESMYREVQGFSGKSKITEDSSDYCDSKKKKKKTPADIKESLRVLNNKLQETPRGLMRSSSYNHSKEFSSSSSSSFAVPKDAPRFSYDGREVNNRVPFDASEISRSKYREFLKLPEASTRNSNTDSKSDGIHSTKQTPSVVAKLMGLEALPHPSSSGSNSSKSPPYEDDGDIRISSNSKSSPRWRSHDSSKHLSRIPVEPAPWKQIDGSKNSTREIPRSKRAQTKATTPSTPYHSVYSEIEKRIKDLEFTESGKDLRALKQILDAMQSKGFLEPEKEDKDAVDVSSSSNDQRNQKFGPAKRRLGYQGTHQSPIVIMKPAKLVEECNVNSASVIPLEGFGLGAPKFRTAKDLLSGYILRENAVNSKTEGALRRARGSTTAPPPAAKEGSSRPGRSPEPISPRPGRKPVLDRRSRPPPPPTPPHDSRKPRRQAKQHGDSDSPGGRRRTNSAEKQSEEIGIETKLPIGFRSNETNPWSSNEDAEGNPDLVGKMAEEEAAEFGFVPPEFSSPVSVLDNAAYREDSPSPVKFVTKTIPVDASADHPQRKPDASSETSAESASAFDINRKKLENVENLVQKLRRLNSKHDEARTDYIASLCGDNADPDNRYVSEILLASGLLLLREPANFQFHPSGNPVNPELFLVLEQTKGTTLLQETQSKLHRKLVFDSVNEILARKLNLARSCKKAMLAQELLRELCSEIEVLKGENRDRWSSGEEAEDERWRKILRWDVMNDSKRWTDPEEQISGAVLDIERLIFKDLVDEIVIGVSSSSSSSGSNGGRGRRRRLIK